ELDAGRIHYRWDGPEDGPVIVMVHGYSTPNFVFHQNVDALTGAGFRVLRYDHFGRGWSDRPRVKYDTEFYDQELLQLLDRLGVIAPIGLVGLSMGGPITAEFTARRPERVRKLFLFVPAGFDVPGGEGVAAALVRTPIIGDWIWRMFGKAILLGSYEGNVMPEPHRQLAGDVEVQMAYRGYGYALLSSLRHFPMSGREETYQRLGESGVPVRALFGDLDETVLISSADKLSVAVPAAEIEIIEGGTHQVNFQRYDEVNPRLVDWFTDETPTSIN
ncbi:MAG: alpha/beta hydrolase, partial [Pseudomonadota bacterium]